MGNMNIKKWTHTITALVVICTGLFLYFGIENDLFSDMNSLKQFINNGGILGPLIFIFIQIIQVVIPIIPGGISCAAGVILFGPWGGLAYNYIGIVIGSFINFYIARQYGMTLVKSFVSEATYDKYSNWLEKGQKFDKFFALAIFFPVAPDDFLCMLAGLTKMSLKKFSAIILLGKPASIAMYSLALVYAGSWLGQFISLT